MQKKEEKSLMCKYTLGDILMSNVEVGKSENDRNDKRENEENERGVRVCPGETLIINVFTGF